MRAPWIVEENGRGKWYYREVGKYHWLPLGIRHTDLRILMMYAHLRFKRGKYYVLRNKGYEFSYREW